MVSPLELGYYFDEILVINSHLVTLVQVEVERIEIGDFKSLGKFLLNLI